MGGCLSWGWTEFLRTRSVFFEVSRKGALTYLSKGWREILSEELTAVRSGPIGVEEDAMDGYV